MMPACALCGNFHNTPRQSKNCELRFRDRIQSSPKAPEAHVWPHAMKFDESAVYSAYLSWKSSLEDELVDNPHN